MGPPMGESVGKSRQARKDRSRHSFSVSASQASRMAPCFIRHRSMTSTLDCQSLAILNPGSSPFLIVGRLSNGVPAHTRRVRVSWSPPTLQRSYGVSIVLLSGPIWSTKLHAVAFRLRTIRTSFVCASRFSGARACKYVSVVTLRVA